MKVSGVDGVRGMAIWMMMMMMMMMMMNCKECLTFRTDSAFALFKSVYWGCWLMTG